MSGNTGFSFNQYNTESMEVNLEIDLQNLLGITDGGDFNVKIKIGNLISIDGQKQMQIIPRYAMGNKKAIGLANGRISYAGTLVFGVVSYSSFVELKKALLESLENFDNDKIKGYIEKVKGFTSFSSLPLFNIKITCSNKNTFMTKEFQNVKLASRGSSVGVSSILVQEAYQFTCSKIAPIKEEAKEKEQAKDYDDTKFDLA